MSGLPPSRGELILLVGGGVIVFSVLPKNRGQHHMVKKKKSVRMEGGELKKERAIVQSVTDPMWSSALSPTPQSPGGKRGGLGDLRKVMLGPFLFQSLESQISRAYLKCTKNYF